MASHRWRCNPHCESLVVPCLAVGPHVNAFASSIEQESNGDECRTSHVGHMSIAALSACCKPRRMVPLQLYDRIPTGLHEQSPLALVASIVPVVDGVGTTNCVPSRLCAHCHADAAAFERGRVAASGAPLARGGAGGVHLKREWLTAEAPCLLGNVASRALADEASAPTDVCGGRFRAPAVGASPHLCVSRRDATLSLSAWPLSASSRRRSARSRRSACTVSTRDESPVSDGAAGSEGCTSLLAAAARAASWAISRA